MTHAVTTPVVPAGYTTDVQFLRDFFTPVSKADLSDSWRPIDSAPRVAVSPEPVSGYRSSRRDPRRGLLAHQRRTCERKHRQRKILDMFKDQPNCAACGERMNPEGVFSRQPVVVPFTPPGFELVHDECTNGPRLDMHSLAPKVEPAA